MGIPVLKPYVNLHLQEFDNLKDINEFKQSWSGFKKEKCESKW